MPHLRDRFLISHFKKLHSFWPIVGVLGLRQVGKSTFLRELIGIKNQVTLDDEDIRDEANASAKVFLAKLNQPCVIDEVQKVPKLFDALKSDADKRKTPGKWIITGSVFFQNLSAIRESLTGRVGLTQLHPMTLAEINQWPFQPIPAPLISGYKPRTDIVTFSKQMNLGGVPVPAFLRDAAQRELYFRSWLDTLINRDAAKVFGPSYDVEVTDRILHTVGKVLVNGEHPQLTDFKIEARKLKKYLKTLEVLFLLRKFSVHEEGIGKDFWLPTDSGLALHLMNYKSSPEVNLSLARIFLLNEIIANYEYQGKPIRLSYFKSQHGSVVDFAWNNIPIKVVSENISSSKIGWIEKPVLGAMKKLSSSQGIIVAPIDLPHIEKEGVSILPWNYWS